MYCAGQLKWQALRGHVIENITRIQFAEFGMNDGPPWISLHSSRTYDFCGNAMREKPATIGSWHDRLNFCRAKKR